MSARGRANRLAELDQLERPADEEITEYRERNVLASLFLHPDRADNHGRLAGRHFQNRTIGKVYDHVRELIRTGGRPTVTSVAVATQSSVQTLLSYINDFGQLVNAEAMAPEIIRSAILRQIHEATASGAEALDIARMVSELSDEVLGQNESIATMTAKGMTDAVMDRVRQIHEGTEKAGATMGVPTLDRYIHGFRRGTLFVTAARPGMGKTVFAVSTARQCAKAGNAVAFFSLELNGIDIGARFISDQARECIIRGKPLCLPYTGIMTGTSERAYDDELGDAAAAIDQLPLWINCASGMTVSELRAEAKAIARAAERRGRRLELVVVDYLKFLKASDRYKGNRVLEIGEITAGLRQMAKDMQVCVHLMVQLNRAVEGREDKRPVLSDLRDSGEIEQDADVVMMLHRDAYYLRRSQDEKDKGRIHDVIYDMDLFIEKNRGGPCESVKLFCDVSTSSVRMHDNDIVVEPEMML